VAAEVLGSFSEGSGTGEWTYTGTNNNIYCADATKNVGQGSLAWNRNSGNRVPGEDEFCVQSGSTNYSVLWPARYVENRSTTHLNFEDDVNVKESSNRGVVGQGTTAWANVVVAGTTTVVGQARVDLTQYTEGSFVGNDDGFACLQQTPSARLEFVVGGDTTTPALASLCW
jgi:hypothetical protein